MLLFNSAASVLEAGGGDTNVERRDSLAAERPWSPVDSSENAGATVGAQVSSQVPALLPRQLRRRDLHRLGARLQVGGARALDVRARSRLLPRVAPRASVR